MKIFPTSLATSLLLLFLVTSCKKSNPNFQQEAANPAFMHRSLKGLTAVIKHDLFPPMIAARIYGYAHIAAYEALNAQTPQYKSLAKQLKDLGDLPKAEEGKEYCLPVAAVKAYFRVGKQLTFSGDSADAELAKIMTDFDAIGIPSDVFKRSVALGDTVGGAILKWAAKDNYAQIRSYPKYTVKLNDGMTWQPTMPDYAEALEPHWNKMRPLTLDSAAQFKPVPPTPYSADKTSIFYKEAYEVYKTVADSTPDRIATAWYWDDNPAATLNAGHFNITRKKITPGGHWLWISHYASQQSGKNIYEASEAYMKVAVGLFDAFISCWDEKYRSEVVRPETYIGKHISPNWTPIINTPPFPEYTSGHSCISGVSATILADVFGAQTAFTDSTEVQFGLPARSFKSFEEAATQAAYSRLYAGIHYRPACEVGLTQGQAIAKHILSRLKTR